MTKGEFLSKRKIHFLFSGGFLTAIAFSVVTNMVAGQRFFDASAVAVREVNPIVVVMICSFWYSCAFYRPTDEWSSLLTVLNLQRREKKKL